MQENIATKTNHNKNGKFRLRVDTNLPLKGKQRQNKNIGFLYIWYADGLIPLKGSSFLRLILK